MKLLANENFPIASVRLLRELGFDIIAIGEDNRGITDQSVMDLAESEQRTILTFDRDYGELIYKHNYKPEKGVIYLRLDHYSPEEPGIMINQLLSVEKIETARFLTVFDGKVIRQRRY